ncbi:MAG: hypothetical protein M1819_002190 [Sarea resinae]|nr:MAG: hypothetical protein M1819_002190 [Sarea resinae]
MPARDAAKDQVWTELFCSELLCDHHDNFARSFPYAWQDGYNGAILYNKILNDSENPSGPPTVEPLADLKAQIVQWSEFEKRRVVPADIDMDAERNGTVFVIQFGLWDIWHYSEWRTKGAASLAIRSSMDEFSRQLDVLANLWPTHLKVIIPNVIDPTFLPGWHGTRTTPRGTDLRADSQRLAVDLVVQWNNQLDTIAQEWANGTIYIFDTQSWLIDQIREHQMHSQHQHDINGWGTKKPMWDDVHVACIGGGDQEHHVEGESRGGQIQCKRPDKYLFRDDMHLSAAANKLLAQQIVKGASKLFDLHSDKKSTR